MPLCRLGIYAVLYPYSLNASSATSFIRITKPLSIYTQSCTHVAKRIEDATSLLWATRPLTHRQQNCFGDSALICHNFRPISYIGNVICFGGLDMKKILISLLLSLFIMLGIPYIIVELARPSENARSTEPVAPTETVTPTPDV